MLFVWSIKDQSIKVGSILRKIRDDIGAKREKSWGTAYTMLQLNQSVSPMANMSKKVVITMIGAQR